MNENELYAQYQAWQQGNEPEPQENPAESYASDPDQLQRPIVAPELTSAAAAVPHAVVRHVEDLGHTKSILPTIGAAVRSWDTSVGWNPGRSVEEMILAWGQGDMSETLVNRIGEDMAQYDRLRTQLASRGLHLQPGARQYIEAVNSKLTRELGSNWRGRLDGKDEDDLVSAAGLAVAVAQSTVPASHRADYESAIWTSMWDRVAADLPEYKGDVHRLRSDVGTMEEFIDGARGAGYFVPGEEATGVVKQWVEMVTGQPWDFKTGTAAAALEPVVKRLQAWHAQSLESEKWRRLGASIPPENTLPANPELGIFEVPFGREAHARYAEAFLNRVSYNDPYGQAWDNAIESVKSRLTDRPEEILGRMWKFAPTNEMGQQWWKETDAAIRAEKDPDIRFETFVKAVKRSGTKGMQQEYFNLLRELHTEDVARQRAHILDMRGRNIDFDPSVAKALEEQSYQTRAAQVSAQEHLEKAEAGSLIFRTVNWAQNAASALVQTTGLPKLEEALVSPVLDTVLNDAVYQGVDKRERAQMDQLGSLGDWVGRDLGSRGLAEEWSKKYADKVVAGQAGNLDSLFYTGAMIYSGFRSMPAFMADHPIEALALGKVLGAAHKARGPMSAALREASVPEPLIAMAELAVDPLAPGRAFNTLVGRTPEVVRALGQGERSFIRHLQEAPPEYAAKAERWANESLGAAKRAGQLRDANQVAGAQAVYSSLLARAQNGGRVTRNEVRDFARMISEESPAIMRRTFAPFARHGDSHNVLLNILSYHEEMQALMAQEEAMVKEIEPLMEGAGTTPAHLFVDAYQAFHEGRLEQWKKVIPSWIPEGVRSRMLGIVDRRIQVGQSLPQLEPLAWEAARRLGDLQDFSRGHQSLMEFARQRARQGREAILSQATAYDAIVNSGSMTQEGVQYLAAELLELQKRDLGLAEIERVTATNGAIVQELASNSMTHRLGVQGPEQGKQVGLEDGHVNTLRPEQKSLVAGWLFDLATVAPEELGRLGLSRAVHTAATGAAAAWKRATEENRVRNRALNWAVKAYSEGDLAKTQEILRSVGVLSKAEAEGLMDGIGELRRRVKTLDETLSPTFARRLSEDLDKNKAWDVPKLDADMSEAIQAVRQKIGEYAILAKSAPSAGLTDFLIDPAYITAGRLTGLVTQQMESGSHAIQILREQLDDSINQMPLEYQRVLAKVNILHPTEWPDNLPAQVRQAALDTRDFQHRIIKMAEDVGEISPEEAGRLRGRGWDDRYYVSDSMRRDIEAAGMRIHDDSLLKTSPLAQAAPLERFRPQASFKYARFLYRDWGNGGAWTERDFVVRDGKTGAALREAESFRDDLLARGLIRKWDYQEPIAPMTHTVSAMKGLVDSNSDFRLDKIRQLFMAATKRELFAQLGQMGGLVRRDLGDVPLNQHGAWVRATGQEWGTMDGKLIHKSLIKQMNAWTNYTGVLEAIAKEGLSYTKELDTKLARSLEVVGGKPRDPQTLGAKVVNFLDRMDTIIRHNKIMWNQKSWMNNIMGNLSSAIFAGVNPMSSSFWKPFVEYDRLYDNLSETVARADEAREQGRTTIETEFVDSARFGFWQRSLDAPGEGAAISSRYRTERMANMSRLVHKYDVWQQAAERGMAELMTNKRLKGRTRTDLKHNVEVYREMGKQAYQNMMHEATKLGVVDQLREGLPLKPGGKVRHAVWEEVKAFVGNPDNSLVRRYVASQYSRIDSKAKWAAYRSLREQGASPEQATERVAHYFQNFGAVHPVVRGLRRLPVVGSFVPGYPAEAARIGWNIMRENPGAIVNYFMAIGAWNSAALFSSGMMPSDALQMGNDKSTMDFMRRMFFSVMIPSDDGMQSLDLTQFTTAAPFLQPSGIGAPAVSAAGDWLDSKMGPLSLPVQMMGNWISSFVANTPISSSLTRYGMGVDPFSKELVYQNSTTGETLAKAGKEFLSYFTPATFVNWASEASDYARGPISLITRHNSSGLERAARGLSGLNLRNVTRNEAMARILLEHGGKNLAAQMYVEGLGVDELEYKSTVFQLREAPTEAEVSRLFREAQEMARGMTKKSMVIGGQRFTWEMDDQELAEKVIRDASADIYGTIERLPVDRLVAAARQLSAGIGRPTDPEMRHIWRCLTDPRYLSSKDDAGVLTDAAIAAQEYADSAADPYAQRQFERVVSALSGRLWQLRRAAVTQKTVNLMEKKLGARPRYVLEKMARRLGLSQ